MKNVLVILCVLIFSGSFAQQTDIVDFKTAHGMLSIIPDSSKVVGKISYKVEIMKSTDSIFLDAVNMTYNNVGMAGESVDSTKFSFSKTNKKIVFNYPFRKGESYILSFDYSAKPKKALYFLKQNNAPQIWTQGQGKYTSNWLPSIDDVNDKIEFDLSISYPNDFEVLANGKLSDKQIGDSLTTWRYDMQKPMSSYLVALAIGNYKKKTETSKSGIPLEYYYYPKDSLKVEPTYRYSKKMFDYLEEEIGFGYPWQNYKQVPVHDFLYAGMENTSLTIFSDAFVVDSIAFNDKNYVNVNAHELAHQWFGNLVTSTSSEHHWLQEGFATYYALLAERFIFGDDYYYFKLYESVIDLGRQDLSGKGTSLLDANSSSLTFYQRGAWVLHVLREQVGDAVFKQAVKNYLNKHQFATVATADFISEVAYLYGKSLAAFSNLWIKQKAFPFDKAFELLKQQSNYINEYAKVDCEAKSSKCADYLKYYASDDAKVKIISQVPELITADVFKNSLKVRQAISQHMTKIPEDLKSDYESLLDDKSYLTIERALYNLWTNFPLDRSRYLAKTRSVMGFSDYNVRLLWLVLNLNTPYYTADNKQELYNELVNYTNEDNNADLRINAFRYLDMINSCDTTCISNLETAKSHHNWRLVKFAKELSEKSEQNKN